MPAQGVDSELARAKGQSIQSIVARLGAPDSEDKTASGAVYTWEIETKVEGIPTIRTITEYNSGRPVTYEKTTYGPGLRPCLLQISTDAAGVVSTVEKRGWNNACVPFADKLSGKE